MRRLLLMASLGLLVTSCGYTLDSARETAAQRTCAWYDKCGSVGSGKTYASSNDCLTSQRANWLNVWPTSTCENKLNASNLDTCLKAIDNTQCNNAIDWLATITKCTSGAVCTGN